MERVPDSAGGAVQKPSPGCGSWLKKGLGVASVVVVIGVAAALAFSVFDLQISSSEKPEGIGPSFPPGGPAEFLYLDSARVATYLAQVDGGTVESEKLTRKLTQSLSASISLEKAGEAGASRSVEAFAERTLKPTAASSFFALRNALVQNKVIKVIRPRFFQADVEDLPRGPVRHLQDQRPVAADLHQRLPRGQERLHRGGDLSGLTGETQGGEEVLQEGG